MANHQNKSPYQSNRGTPHNNSNDPSLCALVNKPNTNDLPSTATRPPQKDKPSAHSTPLKNRSGRSTPRQSQSNKQSGVSTPTNSLACTPRDKTSKPPGNTSTRPLPTRDKPPPFSPNATSTPRSPQNRDRQPSSSIAFRIGLNLTDNSQAEATTHTARCPPCPCPPCTTSNETDSARQICFCPVPTGSFPCLPRNGVMIERSKGPSLASKGPEGVKTERILKLEILSISGGTFYDVDKIHQHGSPIRTEPKYDPCFDVDRIAPKPATIVSECDSETTMESDSFEYSRGKGHNPALVQEEEEDTVAPRCSEGAGYFARDAALSECDLSITPDSLTVPDAPRKQQYTGSDDDIVRSAPAQLAPHNLSGLSLTDMPQVRGEKGGEIATEMKFKSGQFPGLGDDYVPIGDVSVPLQESGLLDISDVDFKEQAKDGEAGRTVGREREEDEESDEEDDEYCQWDTKNDGTSAKASGERIPTDERSVEDQGRGSISLILGPSVRNVAHIAMSPLIYLRSFLGPAPTARPARSKRVRRLSDDLGHPDCRMRSIRSAFVATPYETAASSLGFFLRRQIRQSRKPPSPESESSNEDA